MNHFTAKRWQQPRAQRPMPLFEPRPSSRPTSLAAGRSVAHAIGHIEGRILERIAACGEYGATAEETAIALELRPATASARFSELSQARRIVDSGRTRPTSSGRAAVVWIISQKGEMPGTLEPAVSITAADGADGDQTDRRASEPGRPLAGAVTSRRDSAGEGAATTSRPVSPGGFPSSPATQDVGQGSTTPRGPACDPSRPLIAGGPSAADRRVLDAGPPAEFYPQGGEQGCNPTAS